MRLVGRFWALRPWTAQSAPGLESGRNRAAKRVLNICNPRNRAERQNKSERMRQSLVRVSTPTDMLHLIWLISPSPFRGALARPRLALSLWLRNNPTYALGGRNLSGLKQLGYIAVPALLLAGCYQANAPVPNVQQEIAERKAVEYEKDLQEKAFADKKESAAKGIKTCFIKQYTSAYKAKQLWPLRDNPYTYVYSSKSSNIHFRVERGGSVGVAVGESAYPGMKSFFLIGSGRYSADGDHYADVSGALPALKQDVEIKYAWHNWPHRTEINETDVFAGFSEAYSNCLKFLRGETSS